MVLYVPDIEPGIALKSLAGFADILAVTTDQSQKYFKKGVLRLDIHSARDSPSGTVRQPIAISVFPANCLSFWCSAEVRARIRLTWRS